MQFTGILEIKFISIYILFVITIVSYFILPFCKLQTYGKIILRC